MIWQDFMFTAAAIVAAEKRLWPYCEAAECAGGGGSSGKFSRKGTGLHERSYEVPASISALINQNASAANLDPALAAKQNTEYSSLMDETPETQPGFSSLLAASEIVPTEYSGRDSLTNISKQDPFSGDFEAGTEAAYRDRAGQAMAQAASGPEAVRGGDARTGIAWSQLADQLARQRGYEVRDARVKDAAMVSDAATSMADIEQKRTDTGVKAATGLSSLASGVAEHGLGAAAGVDRTKQYNLNMLQLVASLMGKTLDRQTDDFSGRGDQGGWQAGISCCFIFMEALGQELPWFVEIARHEFFTPEREAGYKWMSNWLVPAMQRHKAVRHLVNWLLIKPFLRWGAYYYGEAKGGWLLAPYVWCWFALWQVIGERKCYGR